MCLNEAGTGSTRLLIPGYSNSVMSSDDISIDQFLFFFLPFTQHVITHISSRVAIIVLRLIILTDCLRLAKVLDMENKLMPKAMVFFENCPK